jgi:hypothetical protein
MLGIRLLVCCCALRVGGGISRIPFTGDPAFGASNGLLLSDHDIDEPNRSPDTKKSQVGGFLQGEKIRMRFNLVKSIRTPARASQKGS